MSDRRITALVAVGLLVLGGIGLPLGYYLNADTSHPENGANIGAAGLILLGYGALGVVSSSV